MKKDLAKRDVIYEIELREEFLSSGGFLINKNEEIKKFMDSEKSICPNYTKYKSGETKIVLKQCRVCKGRNYGCLDYERYLLREINVDCGTVKKVLEHRIVED